MSGCTMYYLPVQTGCTVYDSLLSRHGKLDTGAVKDARDTGQGQEM